MMKKDKETMKEKTHEMAEKTKSKAHDMKENIKEGAKKMKDKIVNEKETRGRKKQA